LLYETIRGEKEGFRSTLCQSKLGESGWKAEDIWTARGLSFRIDGKLPGNRFIFRSYEGTRLYQPSKNGLESIDLSPKEEQVIFANDIYAVFRHKSKAEGFTELQRYVFGRGWDEQPLMLVSDVVEIYSVSVGLWLIAFSPNLHHCAFFSIPKNESSIPGHGSNLYVLDLPDGKARLLASGVKAENSSLSSMGGMHTLTWMDDMRLIYQSTESKTDLEKDKNKWGLDNVKNLQQVLYVVDVESGKQVLRLPVQDPMGIGQRLWREPATGKVHYLPDTSLHCTYEEYIVDLEGKKLIPISSDLPLYFKRGGKMRDQIEIWERKAKKSIMTMNYNDDHSGILFSRDNRFAAFCAGKDREQLTLWIYELESGRLSQLAKGRLKLVGWVD